MRGGGGCGGAEKARIGKFGACIPVKLEPDSFSSYMDGAYGYCMSRLS